VDHGHAAAAPNSNRPFARPTRKCSRRTATNLAVAVRSSATAEDLPDASFAGQQETFLNVAASTSVLVKIHEVFASLYNDRAIAYRVHHGFEHEDVALSAGIQLMVRAGTGAAGVMFTLDTESGYRDVVFITSSYGLGESVVQGAVNPDEFYLFKPNLRPTARPSAPFSSAARPPAWSTATVRRRAHRRHPGCLRQRFSITDARRPRWRAWR
jgi:pyruvate, water dikinase